MRQWKKNLGESPDKDIPEAEDIAYDELKPKYLSDFISRYKYVAEFSAALKKDPVNKKIAGMAKRLRDEEDYDEDESRKYAIKKQKFLIEKKMDDNDPPSYEENAEHQHYPIKHKGLCFSNKPISTIVKGVIVNEERRDGPNPLFHRAFILSGAIKLLKMFTCLVFH